MGRRGAVEVPRGRLDRALGRAARRGDRYPGVGEPAVRAGGLALLRAGVPVDEVVARLTQPDDERGQRQLGIVDAQGRAATYTGETCSAWAGGRTGPCFAAQGNILVSADTVDALAETFEATADTLLADRLLAALASAQAAGGDSRGEQSAALLVVQREGGYAALSDVLVDLRVDDHEHPIDELARLYELHQQLFGRTPLRDWLPLEGDLRTEVDERLARLGYDSLDAWAGVENLEERVNGEDNIDPVVLDALRETSS